jgi:anti-sigma factor RsiW
LSVRINISNYESYLLSYIDGELNREELAELELFLQKHPRCRQELELLEGARLVPDEKIVFEDKASLYRTGLAGEVDYETLMLGYIDGELTPAEAQTLQEYLEKHPAAQKELAFLQSAKLTPDTSVVFADKASLYRSSERKPAPVYRRMGWIAAAAAVVAGLFVWLLPAPDRQPQAPSVAGNTVVTPVKPAPAPPATPLVQENTPAPVVVPVTPSAPQLAKNNKPAVSPKKAAAPVVKAPALAASPRPEAPVISQLPPQRHSTDELMEHRMQQPGNAPVAVAKPEVNNEPVLATSTALPASPDNEDKIVPVTTPQRNPGELIASVSGSDSKILDKVTNVAKFFSRKRNK